jgi:hypothetical protein
VAQDTDKWPAVLNRIVRVQVPYKVGSSLTVSFVKLTLLNGFSCIVGKEMRSGLFRVLSKYSKLGNVCSAT